MWHSSDLSCMVVNVPCFSVVSSLTNWYAFLLLFILRHASTSWHWHSMLVSFAIFIPVLIFLSVSIMFTPSLHLASSFLQVSALVTSIQNLRVNTGLQFSCCVSIPLLKWVSIESKWAFSSTSVHLLLPGKHSSLWDRSTSKDQTWFFAGFVFLVYKTYLESNHHAMVASNICT